MAYIDSWGRKSNTLEEAKEKILESFRQDKEEYYESISDYLDTFTLLKWIMSNSPSLWEKFKKDFSKDIKEIELDWANYYFGEIEEIDN